MPAPPTSSLHRPWTPPRQPYPYNHEIPYQSHGNHHPYRAPYPGAEGDMNLRKRMRMDDPLGIHHQDFFDVERRSKLIRDHGSGPGVGDGNGCGLAYAANPGSHPYLESNGDYSLPDGRTQVFQRGTGYPDPRGEYPPEMSRYCGGNVVGGGGRHYSFDLTRPPLPPSPPPPLPPHPPMQSLMPNGRGHPHPIERPAGALFPVDSNVSTSSPSVYYPTRQVPSPPSVFSKEKVRNKLSPPKLKIVDASSLFKHPHRTFRPDHFVIILRGLPGSGKSYMAKMLRDLEVEQGGSIPRIFSIDDYFMTEVEKAEESEASNSLSKGKRPAMKKVMEYCYEPEMEEAYRSSMLKAYRKIVEEGTFTFIIVDDRNLRVADFAQFWAIGKSSGYEVYILEATYKDPEGCAARNIHGFTFDNIQKMAEQWEQAPVLYLRLDVKSLFHSDDLKEGDIQEVDMDMEDDVESPSATVERKNEKPFEHYGDSNIHNEHNTREGERWDAEAEHPLGQVGALGRSKWSDDLEELENDIDVSKKDTVTVISRLDRARGMSEKSVHWGDQGGDTGFSLAKKANAISLVIGPGAGYNLKSNPLPKDEKLTQNYDGSGIKRKNVFQEQLLAEQESFKAVFERRRQRLGGLNAEDD
ncbi:hypothetical protein MLD38_039469 [Melastoma candidum]|uniref:Uncharacterized protein n=1 Tax=Melastoma candidum TaxID=119954 RepID=A0ACB9L3K2_9MYRT|nr:hypothetical protein MLD38_039469 [Melastoma candidum]